MLYVHKQTQTTLTRKLSYTTRTSDWRLFIFITP